MLTLLDKISELYSIYKIANNIKHIKISYDEYQETKKIIGIKGDDTKQ